MKGNQFNRIRLTTLMDDACHTIKNGKYPSQMKDARNKLVMLQEQYKSEFGEYSPEHLLEKFQEPKDRYPELYAIAEDMADEIMATIDERTKDVKTDLSYNSQFVLEELIKLLEKHV